MSITFSCGHCGKSFTLDDKFAGKKGKCKQCGGTMVIPGSASGGETEAAGPNHRESSPTTRRAPAPATAYDDVAPPPTRRSASREDDSATVDPYGLDEEAMPSRAMPARSGVAVDSADAPIPRAISPVKKKKKKGKSGPSWFRFGEGDSPSILKRVLLGLAITFVVIPGVSAIFFGVNTPRVDIRKYYEMQITMMNRLNQRLQNVQDLDGAVKESIAINQQIRAMSTLMRDNMRRKGRVKDIEQLTAEFQPMRTQVSEKFASEIQRLANIEGVIQALNMEAAIQELASIEEEAQRLSRPGANGGRP